MQRDGLEILDEHQKEFQKLWLYKAAFDSASLSFYFWISMTRSSLSFYVSPITLGDKNMNQSLSESLNRKMSYKLNAL